MLQPHQGVCLGEISNVLAQGDIHPPLYFWLLNLWSLMFGVHTWTGPSLNVVIAAMACVALFSLARYVLRDSFAAATVALLWTVSPAVLGSTLEARQYDLLALWAILFVAQVLRCSDPDASPTWRSYVALVAITSAGLLTHFHFGLIGLAGALFVAGRLVRRDRRRLLAVCGFLLAGCAVFAAVHPRFHESIPRARLQAQKSVRSPKHFQRRVDRMFTNYMSFGFDINGLHRAARPNARYVALCATVVALMASMAPYALRRWRRSRRTRTGAKNSEWHVLYFLFAMAGANIALYLSYQSPLHAMGPRYMSMVCPFLAFLPVMAARVVPRFGCIALMGLLSVLFVYAGVQRVARYQRHYRKTVHLAPSLAAADRVVIDEVRRGVLPCLIWHIPDDMLVFAATDKDLIASPERWMKPLRDGDVFLDSTRVNRLRARRIAMILSQRFNLRGAGILADTAWIAVLEER